MIRVLLADDHGVIRDGLGRGGRSCGHELGPRCWALCAAVLLPLAGSAPAAARDGDRREARVEGTCAKGAESKLRLRSRDGSDRVTVRASGPRGVSCEASATLAA